MIITLKDGSTKEYSEPKSIIDIATKANRLFLERLRKKYNIILHLHRIQRVYQGI